METPLTPTPLPVSDDPQASTGEHANTPPDEKPAGAPTDHAEKLANDVRRRVDRARERLEEAQDAAEIYTRRHPWHMVALAGAVGLIAGFLLADRRKR